MGGNDVIPTYSVEGMVSGLTALGMILQNNADDTTAYVYTASQVGIR